MARIRTTPEHGFARHRWTAAAVGVVGTAGVAGSLAIGLDPVVAAALTGAVIVASVAALAWTGRRGRTATGPGVVAAHFSIVAIIVLAAIQVVPYGREHANPPVTGEPAWASERTRELIVNACYGCHSNEVDWPWYSNVAPFSWAVTSHVEEGRDAVNYSEFATRPGEADETVEVILEGSMPPAYYTAFGLHPEADLSEQEVAELVAGLRNTPGLSESDDPFDDDEEDDRD